MSDILNSIGEMILGGKQGEVADKNSIGAGMYDVAKKAGDNAQVTMDAIGNTGLLGLPHLIQSKVLGDSQSVNARNKLAEQNPVAKTVGDTASMLLNPASITGKLYSAGATSIPKLMALGAGMGAEYSAPRALTGMLSGEKTGDQAAGEVWSGSLLGGLTPGLLSAPSALKNSEALKNTGKFFKNIFSRGAEADPLGEAITQKSATDYLVNSLGLRRDAIESYMKSQQGSKAAGKAGKTEQAVLDAADLALSRDLRSSKSFLNLNEKAGQDFDTLTAQIKPGDFNISAPVNKNGVKTIPSWIKGSEEYETLARSHPKQTGGSQTVNQAITDRLDELHVNHWSKASNSKYPMATTMDDLRERVQYGYNHPQDKDAVFNADIDNVILNNLYKKSFDVAEKKGGMNFVSGVNSVAELKDLYHKLRLPVEMAKSDIANVKQAIRPFSVTQTLQQPENLPRNALLAQVQGLVNNMTNKLYGGAAAKAYQKLRDPEFMTAQKQNLDKLKEALANAGRLNPEAAKMAGYTAGMAPSASADLGQIATPNQVMASPDQMATPPVATGAPAPVQSQGGMRYIPGGQMGIAAPQAHVTAGGGQRFNIEDQSPGMAPGPLSSYANPEPGVLTQALSGLMGQRQQPVAPQMQDPFDVSGMATPDLIQAGVFNPDGSKTRYGTFVDSKLREIYMLNRFDQQGLSYQEFFNEAKNNSGGFDPVMVASFQGAFPTEKAKENFLEAYQKLQTLKDVDLKPFLNSPLQQASRIFDWNYGSQKEKLKIALSGVMGGDGSLNNKMVEADNLINEVMDKPYDNKTKVQNLKNIIAAQIGINTGDLHRLGLDVGTPLEGVYGR